LTYYKHNSGQSSIVK